MADNADSNDTAVEELCSKLNEGHDPEFDAEERRLRCLGHIINLAAKAFLFGTDAEAFEREVEIAESHMLSIDEEQELLQEWRKRGPVGKLQNIIFYIRASPQRRQEFAQIQTDQLDEVKGLAVIRDNATRWNSTYLSVHRALKVRTRLEVFMSRHKASITEDILDDDDWRQLQHVQEILHPLHELTLELQSNATNGGYGSIWTTLPTFDIILGHLERMKAKYEDEYPQLGISINLAWRKMDKYYQRTDQTAVYAVAVALEPTLRQTYFERHWGANKGLKKYVQPTLNAIKGMYEDKYQHLAQREHSPEEEQQLASMSILKRHLYVANESTGKRMNEYKTYSMERNVGNFTNDINVFQWWANKGMPGLCQMAFDVLSAPAMSTECERAFSGGQLTVTDRRNRLGPDVVEAIEVTNAWLRRKLI